MDVDIDFKNREDILKHIKHVIASRLSDGELKEHNVGVYAQNMPVDPLTGLAALPSKPHDYSQEQGYFKIDLLNVPAVYSRVKDEKHLQALMDREPLWEILQEKDIVKNLFQISDHYDNLKKMKPQNIHQLAMFLAMIRPAKFYLMGKDWKEVEKEIWDTPTDGKYYWKKSHAYSYAFALKVQMNLILEEAENEV